MDDNAQRNKLTPLYGKNTDGLQGRLEEIFSRPFPPKNDPYLMICEEINRVFETEDPRVRPRDKNDNTGGIIFLIKNIPTIVVPDLHARMDFFLSIMLSTKFGYGTTLELLAAGKIQIVCVGDAFHSEGHQAKRWKLAFGEFQDQYRKHAHMDQEMRESMGLMEMVWEVKAAFPYHFHFLKGNHENILNENGSGNYPFRKYAYEGAMVADYMKKFYSAKLLKKYAIMEKNLPLLAIGNNFIISHSEPQKFFPSEKVINYRTNADVVYGLTWTDNDAADEGSVLEMIQHYLPYTVWDHARYFGGHRPVTGAFKERAEGKYLQIHNPGRFQVAYLSPDQPVDIKNNVIVLEDLT
ncbi:MAG: metallophosphoesterase [Spirochaetales bacterium]|nr:metallophosphoesterase [Spirochaetales bacterium]